MSPRPLTEYDRVTRALDAAQALPCGAIDRTCTAPRAKGDHLCAECRERTKAAAC